MVTLIFWPQSRDLIEFGEEREESSCVAMNINDIDEDINDERNRVRH